MEQIYTIPVNEAFDFCASEADRRKNQPPVADAPCLCPLCRLYNDLTEKELERILGAAMMEPDVRIETNHRGFCLSHYEAMLKRKNRLGLALMLESHLDVLKTELKDSALASTVKGAGGKPLSRMEELENDCYICNRVDLHFGHMIDTVLYLFTAEDAFRRKTERQPYYCLPHFRRLADNAKRKMNRKDYTAFYRTIEKTELNYLHSLKEDVSWFCCKFDYRYENEPWNNAKDAVERSILFLRGTEGQK